MSFCDEIGLLHRKEVSGFGQMDLRSALRNSFTTSGHVGE